MPKCHGLTHVFISSRVLTLLPFWHWSPEVIESGVNSVVDASSNA